MINQQSSLPKQPTKINKKSPITWKSLTVSGIIGAGLVFYVHHLRDEKDKSLYDIAFGLYRQFENRDNLDSVNVLNDDFKKNY